MKEAIEIIREELHKRGIIKYSSLAVEQKGLLKKTVIGISL